MLTGTLHYTTWQEFTVWYYAAEWLKYLNAKSSGLVTFHVLYSVLYYADCLLVLQPQNFLPRLSFVLLLTQKYKI